MMWATRFPFGAAGIKRIPPNQTQKQYIPDPALCAGLVVVVAIEWMEG